MNTFPHKHILNTKQFTRQDLEIIFDKAKEMEQILNGEKDGKLLNGKIMASMFYEPSTRTRLSFESAMRRLGGEVITVSDSSTCSFSKGETIEDNAKIISAYCDIIVMRHSEAYSVDRTAEVSDKPVINAGDGAHQHPTQALLDLYTILKENGRLDNLKVSLVGDLKYGRTTHSLVFLLGLFDDIEFVFISPDELKMPEKVISFLKEKNIKYSEITDYNKGVEKSDVLYVTRIQRERFTDMSEYNEVKDKYILDLDILGNNKDITIMHPLPRVNEIKTEIDSLPNTAFFRQAKNGVPIRMALLYLLLKK
ncbi:MAG: aspartate carbamoyltransferase [Candidatus Gracilibacteria bacterium]|nr:aspartate carbamoyltransferase [Candidatus Gracilibacteria bacterium]